MRPKLLLLFLLVHCVGFAQHQLTKEQIRRLADAGKIYGYVKYFHPWLQYKNINWDSAFAANIEAIIKATDEKDFINALQQSFSVLDDGMTTVANKNGPNRNYQERQLTYNVKDSILHIQMNDAPFMTTDDKLYQALQNLQNVKGAIIDMRRPANSRYYDMLGHSAYFDWSSSFFNGSYSMPSVRTVTYTNFPSEWGGGYNNVAFRENVLSSLTGNAINEVPIVFVVSQEDEVPLIAIKLQEKGKCRILQKKGRKLLPGSSLYFYISDSVLIQMRTGEYIDTDGSLISVHPDDNFTSEDDSTIIFRKAMDLLWSNKSTTDTRKEHPLPIDFSSPYSADSSFPSTGYRMLASAKMFAIIDHFYASKSGMAKNWDTAYLEAIPKFIAAKDSLSYWKAVAEFHAYIQDSHGFIAKTNEGFSLRLNPIIQNRGAFMPPVFTSLVENKVLVTGIFDDSVCRKIGIDKGDVILSINGKKTQLLIEQARKYQNAGNRGSQDFYLASFILFGNEGEFKKLKVQSANGRIKEINMPTLGQFIGNWLEDKYVSAMFSYSKDPTAKQLAGKIIYVDLTSGLRNQDIDSVRKWMTTAKGLIVDMRGYPQGVGLPIESIFQDRLQKVKPVVIYTVKGNPPSTGPNLMSVNRFGSNLPSQQYQIENIIKDKTFNLPLKLVMLINGSGQSNGDYAPFIYKNIYNAALMGTPTAGAMTAFTNYNVPGNLRLWLSWKAIDRAGIQPDIFIEPTVKGIQAQRDEVLERAIKYLQTGK